MGIGDANVDADFGAPMDARAKMEHAQARDRYDRAALARAAAGEDPAEKSIKSSPFTFDVHEPADDERLAVHPTTGAPSDIGPLPPRPNPEPDPRSQLEAHRRLAGFLERLGERRSECPADDAIRIIDWQRVEREKWEERALRAEETLRATRVRTAEMDTARKEGEKAEAARIRWRERMAAREEHGVVSVGPPVGAGIRDPNIPAATHVVRGATIQALYETLVDATAPREERTAAALALVRLGAAG